MYANSCGSVCLLNNAGGHNSRVGLLPPVTITFAHAQCTSIDSPTTRQAGVRVERAAYEIWIACRSLPARMHVYVKYVLSTCPGILISGESHPH